VANTFQDTHQDWSGILSATCGVSTLS